MAGYLIVRVNVKDADAYEEYKKRAHAAVTQHGGKYLVRGGQIETIEGEAETSRIVLLEFPSLGVIKNWYNSPEYKYAIEARKDIATMQLVAVEGV